MARVDFLSAASGGYPCNSSVLGQEPHLGGPVLARRCGRGIVGEDDHGETLGLAAPRREEIRPMGGL